MLCAVDLENWRWDCLFVCFVDVACECAQNLCTQSQSVCLLSVGDYSWSAEKFISTQALGWPKFRQAAKLGSLAWTIRCMSTTSRVIMSPAARYSVSPLWFYHMGRGAFMSASNCNRSKIIIYNIFEDLDLNWNIDLVHWVDSKDGKTSRRYKRYRSKITEVNKRSGAGTTRMKSTSIINAPDGHIEMPF